MGNSQNEDQIRAQRVETNDALGKGMAGCGIVGTVGRNAAEPEQTVAPDPGIHHTETESTEH